MAERTTAKRPRRSAGEGGIYETADGRLRGAVRLADPLTGRQVRKYVTGTSRADVSQKLAKLRKEAEQGGFASKETTGDYLARWIGGRAVAKLRPATLRGYRQHVESYWTPMLGIVPLARLSPKQVERAMDDMIGRGLSPQTVVHARATLRRALHDAQRDGLLVRNAASLARPPEVEKRDVRAMTAPEARRLLEATCDTEFGPLFAVALGTGVRLGELLALRWADVDLGAGTIAVRHALARQLDGSYGIGKPKTKRSERTIAISAIARDGLTLVQERQDAAREAAGTVWQDQDALVFTDIVGRPVSPTRVSVAFRRAADRLGLAGVRFHDTRHTAASLMLKAGVPLKFVSEALGHSTIVVTADVYGHLDEEMRREAAAGLDRALGE